MVYEYINRLTRQGVLQNASEAGAGTVVSRPWDQPSEASARTRGGLLSVCGMCVRADRLGVLRVRALLGCVCIGYSRIVLAGEPDGPQAMGLKPLSISSTSGTRTILPSRN